MVAIIKTGSSVHNVFNYNENKVKLGVAECIAEGNYPVDLEQLNVSMRLNRLLKQNALNENVKRNSVHISLNFDPSEITLSREKLIAIANTYMEKIGFGEQPYLVYQHHDAAHPHIHLVSIKVKPDGSRIDMHNIGRNQSETARKEIEKSFGLIEAQGRNNNTDSILKPIAVSKVRYGRIQSKKAISVVLDGVLSSYKYSSLSELNAVLQLYNVMADRGSDNSRVFKANGLVYRILDTDGKPIGVPIKASDFYNKPTLKFLEQQFASNNNVNAVMKNRIKNAVDLALFGKKIPLTELTKLLEKEGINLICRKNTEGSIYGITYVDHTAKCVFNGSALGKQYSAKTIQERCGLIESTKQNFAVASSLIPNAGKITDTNSWDLFQDKDSAGTDLLGRIVDVLTQSEHTTNYIPNQLKGMRKKKKRKGQSDNQ